MWQVTEPIERSRICIHRSWERVSNMDRFGLTHVHACGKVAYGPTLIKIDHRGVGIYTT